MDELQQLISKFDTGGQTEAPPPVGRVLVIDDDPNIRQGLERTLKQKNYDVVVTTNGDDGIRCLDGDIGCVLLDVKLPKVNGLEVYGWIKEKDPDVPVIFYSAYPGGEDVAGRCMDLKPYAFIEKGVYEDIDRLYALIETAVSGRGTAIG
jgi:DNA-binding NtrC family response regulator